MRQELTLDAFIQRLKSKKLTDKRTGKNIQYEVNAAAQAAFAIFFMQSASVLPQIIMIAVFAYNGLWNLSSVFGGLLI